MHVHTPKSISLILAGAAARGPYEAGALQVVAQRGLPVRRIVGASAGALCGAAYAAGVRARRERDAARELVDVWLDCCDWGGAVHVNLADALAGRGLSDSERVLDVLRDAVRPCRAPDPAPVDLCVVVSPVGGVEGDVGTTYEVALRFRDADFDGEAGVERVTRAAAASAALPGLYAPVDVPGVGLCLDGGAVNCAPVGYALSDDPAEDETVVVVSPVPELLPPLAEPPAGLDLLGHLVDALTYERLYRDLRRAEQINESLLLLEELAEARGWSASDLDAVKAAAGLGRKRRVQIVQVRPLAPLAGNALSGLSDRDLRAEYVRIGRERASAAFDELGWAG